MYSSADNGTYTLSVVAILHPKVEGRCGLGGGLKMFAKITLVPKAVGGWRERMRYFDLGCHVIMFAVWILQSDIPPSVKF